MAVRGGTSLETAGDFLVKADLLPISADVYPEETSIRFYTARSVNRWLCFGLLLVMVSSVILNVCRSTAYCVSACFVDINILWKVCVSA
jgi:hypothetical protein